VESFGLFGGYGPHEWVVERSPLQHFHDRDAKLITSHACRKSVPLSPPVKLEKNKSEIA
jgi:hypothetical protein